MKRAEAVLPVRVGRYTLYEVIGAGGMATVHLAHAAGEGTRSSPLPVVAVKRLRPHFASEPDVVKSFLDEARLSACIRHPNVVRMQDVVTADGEVFLVMEYLEGVPLAALRPGRETEPSTALPPDILVSILASALRGLHAAHEAVGPGGATLNIVHRDVSPQNIFVGADGTTRVLDFGIAKAIGRDQSTRDNRIKGKLGYMAPEQLSARAVTRRTDVFAAGIVLWEYLVGTRLFRADTEAETITRVLMAPVAAPSRLNDTAPPALDAIVLRALERDPSKRFLTAEEMASALEMALAPASAAAVSAWVRRVAALDLDRRARLVRNVETHVATGHWPGASEDGGSLSSLPVEVARASTLSPGSTGTPAPRARSLLLATMALSATCVVTAATVRSVSSARAKPTGEAVSSSHSVASSSASLDPAAPAPPGEVTSPPTVARPPLSSASPSSSSLTPPVFSRGSARHSSPAPSADRQRLYSRD